MRFGTESLCFGTKSRPPLGAGAFTTVCVFFNLKNTQEARHFINKGKTNMGILDREFNEEPEPAKMASRRLIMMTKNSFNQMVNNFNEGSRVFWQNPRGASPQDIAAELGTDAKEVFELHHKLGQLIGSVKPEAITEGVSLVGNFTMNEDGTVTVIVPEPEPAPEETTTPEPE
jgi:hypothetical protein